MDVARIEDASRLTTERGAIRHRARANIDQRFAANVGGTPGLCGSARCRPHSSPNRSHL